MTGMQVMQQVAAAAPRREVIMMTGTPTSRRLCAR